MGSPLLRGAERKAPLEIVYLLRWIPAHPAKHECQTTVAITNDIFSYQS
jgi:hypothetical protein